MYVFEQLLHFFGYAPRDKKMEGGIAPWDILWEGQLQSLKEEFDQVSGGRTFFSHTININGIIMIVEVHKMPSITPPVMAFVIHPTFGMIHSLRREPSGKYRSAYYGNTALWPNADLKTTVLALAARGLLKDPF